MTVKESATVSESKRHRRWKESATVGESKRHRRWKQAASSMKASGTVVATDSRAISRRRRGTNARGKTNRLSTAPTIALPAIQMTN